MALRRLQHFSQGGRACVVPSKFRGMRLPDAKVPKKELPLIQSNLLTSLPVLVRSASAPSPFTPLAFLPQSLSLALSPPPSPRYHPQLGRAYNSLSSRPRSTFSIMSSIYSSVLSPRPKLEQHQRGAERERAREVQRNYLSPDPPLMFKTSFGCVSYPPCLKLTYLEDTWVLWFHKIPLVYPSISQPFWF